MVFDKPFLTYEQQIDLLRSRGLIISDDKFAEQALSTLSYYDLINRYKSHFMNPDDSFNEGITLEYLYNFLLFDKDVQSFVMKYSLLVESIFKTKLAYTLSQYFGVDHAKYLNANNFLSSIDALKFTDIQLEIIGYISSDKVKDPTRHYKLHHNHIPPWILLKNVSLGNSINLYRFLIGNAKHTITDEMIPSTQISFSDKVDFISNALNDIRLFRNSAAHNLNFTELQVKAIYRPSSSTLYKILGNALLKRKKKKIIDSDKQSVGGIYGCLLSILVLLNDDYLRARFITDFLTVISGTEPAIQNQLYGTYSQVTAMPPDIINRFGQYYSSLMV